MITANVCAEFMGDEPVIRKALGPNFRLVSAELKETRTYTDSVHRFYEVTAVSERYRNELTLCVAHTEGCPRLACRLGSDYFLLD
jgi:hypothetical protein